MQKIGILLGFSILLFSCKKNVNLPQDGKGAQSVTGSWKLIAVRSYSFPPRVDTSWQVVNTLDPVNIKFSNDSNFSFSNNYRWKMEAYDRYEQIDSLDFRIYASIPPPLEIFHITLQFLSKKLLLRKLDLPIEE
jgi:hypothetical protein